MKRATLFLGGAAFGAGLMYIADPILGKRRRAIARDAAVHSAKVFGRTINISGRDTANRLKGVFEETKSLFRRERVDDEILADRFLQRNRSRSLHNLIHRLSRRS